LKPLVGILCLLKTPKGREGLEVHIIAEGFRSPISRMQTTSRLLAKTENHPST
jgi:hypothetical protein